MISELLEQAHDILLDNEPEQSLQDQAKEFLTSEGEKAQNVFQAAMAMIYS
jgi:hypothetical protein